VTANNILNYTLHNRQAGEMNFYSGLKIPPDRRGAKENTGEIFGIRMLKISPNLFFLGIGFCHKT
jgi:hypothetical protein